MLVLRTIATTRAAVAERRAVGGGPVGLVPTMGALHAGHRALLDAARADCATVVMSLFVNPAQFGDAADLEAYPRDEARDLAAAEAAGVDLVFAPPVGELYPPGFQTWVDVERLGAILEGVFRPGHYRGVATVVLKLVHIVAPDIAYFGQKDAQQVAVVRTMLHDLDLPVHLRVIPTVRDPDGLALSSRNARLSRAPGTLAIAPPRARPTPDAPPAGAGHAGAGLPTDYLEVVDLGPRVLAAAVRVDEIRLIDNVVLESVEQEPPSTMDRADR
ncbi:MAG: pantoate--beta-alanine ligase [Candidatus Limnocylindrales bacterium]